MGEVEKPDQNQQASKWQGLEALPGLRLMGIGRALALVSGAAVALLVALIVGGLVLLGAQGLKPEAQVSAATLFDLLKIAFTVVAGLGGLVALVVAYRRQKVAEAAQRVSERGEDRAHRAEQREATKLHNDRFATAAGQLGHDSPAVRLAGVHALAGLADDAPTRELRQTCIDVLCAYLRMPYTPHPGKDAPEADRLAFAGMREVRHTVIRLITAHLRENAPVSWRGHDLDFTGVVFDGGDFSHAAFTGGEVSFDAATFTRGMVLFFKTAFAGATVSFNSATFNGGRVFFTSATFTSGKVFFTATTFAGAKVFFAGTAFTGATVAFNDATFSGGEVSFHNAAFTSGGVGFANAAFTGGEVDFRGVRSWEVPPVGLPMPAPPGLYLPEEDGEAAVAVRDPLAQGMAESVEEGPQ
ncbi:pentapeptide repeat-containing protein [Nonomuraea angiospora]|uniref:pentapeptide repeat-containing protein n=1 Tax=Nonomuraea angiospora TaxID=46172 RepID=UPI0033F0A85E